MLKKGGFSYHNKLAKLEYLGEFVAHAEHKNKQTNIICETESDSINTSYWLSWVDREMSRVIFSS